MLLVLFVCKLDNFPFFFFLNYQIWSIINLGYFHPERSISFHLRYSCSHNMDARSCIHILIKGSASARKGENYSRFKTHVLLRRAFILDIRNKCLFCLNPSKWFVLLLLLLLFLLIFILPVGAKTYRKRF